MSIKNKVEEKTLEKKEEQSYRQRIDALKKEKPFKQPVGARTFSISLIDPEKNRRRILRIP